jgi:predicted helicase
MSKSLINTYLGDIDRLRTDGGTSTEEVVREAFKDLLKSWAKSQNLIFVPEVPYQTSLKTTVKPDGTILHDLRVPLGYWEAKDTDDDLDVEIAKKLTKGYPQDNIIFENSHTAVLIQNRAEVVRCSMTDTEALYRLVSLFFGYERPEIAQFRRAVDQFKTDLPAVLEALREKIDAAYASNPSFRVVADAFLAHARDTINPTLTESDVREMLIQHILTEEIFTQVFDSGQFHQENNIAQELFKLERAFFTGAVKADALKVMKPYYSAIRANAAQITSHAEKQTFLKVIYENFYKVYNPKAADRLGVVYTPNEIVRFMIEGADWLCHKHFGKNLIDHGVEILDPATGTGTFICELIETFRGQPQKLHHKYKEELHANEVAILPYYVANLNIEATYAAVAGQYAEFPNLCFVDTLDNVAGLGIKSGYQHDLFGALSDENVERVKRQNKRKISVIIGNPPYNANQQNENDNNKNRAYPRIDDLIKRSFVKLSTAQKTKVYDMYARFFRWSFDRVHDDGIIAFVTNRSFIDSRTFDGFRRYVQENFAEVYVVDLKGDARTSGEQRRKERGNVFDDQIRVGIAISFFVRKRGAKGLKVFYDVVPDYTTSEDKRAWLAATKLSARHMTQVHPDKAANWINQTENGWDEFLPVADKKTKVAKAKGQERAIFRLFSFGLVTNRDEWMYGRDEASLRQQVAFLVAEYERQRAAVGGTGKLNRDELPNSIKWTRSVKKSLGSGVAFDVSGSGVVRCAYRPFDHQLLFNYAPLIEMLNQSRSMFGQGLDAPNRVIALTDPTSQKPFMVLAADCPVDMHLVGAASGASCMPRLRLDHGGGAVDNITDWALNRFVAQYGKAAKITKDDIFTYVYGVLHDPLYRETYAQNLKRELPRIPFYPDFAKWADWGRRLMDLHIGYETVDPWPLTRKDVEDVKARAAGQTPTVKLKADKEAGTITLDTETVLSGIPPVAWTYRLGNRSGLEWVLDQAKEKTPKDPTIRAKFNTYRFADHKERVIDLLTRVTRVSVETMEIVEAMQEAKR